MNVQSAQAGLPPGVTVPYGGSSAPAGWLLCDGSAVSRTTYAALFAAISTTFGIGDGSTTFNVPDLRGRVVAGVDGGAGRLATGVTGGMAAITLAGAGGEHSHTPTLAETFAHAHTVAGTNSIRTNTGAAVLAAGGVAGGPQTMDNAGSSSAHNNVQPTLVLNYIIAT